VIRRAGAAEGAAAGPFCRTKDFTLRELSSLIVSSASFLSARAMTGVSNDHFPPSWRMRTLTPDGAERFRWAGRLEHADKAGAAALGLSLGQKIQAEAGERLLLKGSP